MNTKKQDVIENWNELGRRMTLKRCHLGSYKRGSWLLNRQRKRLRMDLTPFLPLPVLRLLRRPQANYTFRLTMFC